MRHWGFCLILITVVKKSRDYGPRGKSLLYYIPHIPDIPHIPGIPHIPDIPHIPHIPDIPHIPHIPHIPEIFDLGISSQTGFFSRWGFWHIFLGGVFGTTWARTPIPYTTKDQVLQAKVSGFRRTSRANRRRSTQEIELV